MEENNTPKNETGKGILGFLSGKWKFIITGALVILLMILLLITVKSVSTFTLELKEAKIEINKGIEALSQELDNGEMYPITLKESAFAVIDETEIQIDDGISDMETEKILNSYKLGEVAKEDGKLTDSKKNAVNFNKLYNIYNPLSEDVSCLFSPTFLQRLGDLWKQYIYKLDVEYYQQRDTPRVGNVICVPTSARILLSGLGYNVPIEDLLQFFKDDPDLKKFARDRFGRWIEKYIRKNKLYQITGTFAHGLNLYMKKNYPDFPYKLEYDYWDMDKIVKYLDEYGVMSSTYFPRYVLEGKRAGGHMITITKVYRDLNGVVVGFGIHDPFGNPNAKYHGAVGYDGENVVVDYDTMVEVMKSYFDDHGSGSKHLYRVLYFRDKK